MNGTLVLFVTVLALIGVVALFRSVIFWLIGRRTATDPFGQSCLIYPRISRSDYAAICRDHPDRIYLQVDVDAEHYLDCWAYRHSILLSHSPDHGLPPEQRVRYRVDRNSPFHVGADQFWEVISPWMDKAGWKWEQGCLQSGFFF